MTDSRFRYAAMIGIFLLAMLGVRQVAHLAVAGGPLPWLALMGGIFALGIFLENRRRTTEDRPRYSAAEARELALPLSALAVVLALAYCLS
jgi:hypothetical protein